MSFDTNDMVVPEISLASESEEDEDDNEAGDDEEEDGNDDDDDEEAEDDDEAGDDADEESDGSDGGDGNGNGNIVGNNNVRTLWCAERGKKKRLPSSSNMAQNTTSSCDGRSADKNVSTEGRARQFFNTRGKYVHDFHVVDVLREVISDAIQCVVCFECCLAPVRQCLNGDVICGTCIETGQFTTCPVCKIDVANYARNSALEHMARKRKWQCTGSDAGCNIVTEYDEKESHEKTCRFVISYQCPFPECKKMLSYRSMDILKHLKQVHKIVSEPLSDNGIERKTVSCKVKKFAREDSQRCFSTSSLVDYDGYFVLFTVIESSSSLRFRTFYFTDQDAADKVYMKIFIQKDQDEKIRSIERVQCMSDLQNKRRERKELSSYNSLLKVNKQEFSASCFKIEPASKQQMFTFQFSVKVVGLHGTKL